MERGKVTKFTIPLVPRTKKNSQRIILLKGRPKIIPSKAFVEYQKACNLFIKRPDKPIDRQVNLKCIFYMPTRRQIDLCNLLEAICDILVHYKVIKDDNSKIIVSMDGCRVAYDKARPRTEVEITDAE